jgi:hypothetical protein
MRIKETSEDTDVSASNKSLWSLAENVAYMHFLQKSP